MFAVDALTDDLARMSATRLLHGYREWEFSPQEVILSLRDRTDRVDGEVNSFVTTAFERAVAESHMATSAYLRGDARPLEGVPFAVKDLFDTAGIRTTYGSRLFDAHVPTEDAEAVRMLRTAGAICVGKTATHEFGWGITTVNPHFGPVRNPWRLSRVAGGSSGGSAAALAAFETPLALGSDTGGSIRIPAAFCGVLGLKPTYGRVSARGTFPLAPSLDHPGPMARTPRDLRLFFRFLSSQTGEDTKTSAADLRGMRIGVSQDLDAVPLAPDIAAVWEKTISRLKDFGAVLVDIPFPEASQIYETFVCIQRVEATRTHQNAGLFPTRAAAYGEDVRGRLEAASRTSLEAYPPAALIRQRLTMRLLQAFRVADVVLTPVSACSPARIGEDVVGHYGHSIEFRELVMPYTVLQNLTGFPVGTVRAGFDQLGIPVGVQFTAPPWREDLILDGIETFFKATPEVQEPEPQPLTKPSTTL